MIPFTQVRVPVAAAADGAIELYISKTCRPASRRGAEGDWATLRACPEKVLQWFATASFTQSARSGQSGQPPAARRFEPCAQRLAGLDQLKNSRRPPLAVPRVWKLDGADYAFDAGQHIPYWLAVNQASFVPLLVPAHQMAHFSQQLS